MLHQCEGCFSQVEIESQKYFCFRIQDYAPGRCSLASQEVIKVSSVELDVMESNKKEKTFLD